MNTAVQLRPIAAAALPRCDLLHGEPVEMVAGVLGLVALFAPGTLVAYRLRSHQRARLYVFRTLDVADPFSASVPGVRPRVQLLFQLHSVGRVRLAGRLFAHLTRLGPQPSALPDAFYHRLGVALSARIPSHAILTSLPRLCIPERPFQRRTGRALRPRRQPQELPPMRNMSRT